MRNYQCAKCGIHITSNQAPSALNCPKGNHSWTDLGEVGEDNYQCAKCGLVIKSKGLPSSLYCPNGGNHQWSKL